MILAKLLLPKDPEKSEATYTWLGKRVCGLIDIADGVGVFFGPKKWWPKWGIRYCCWAAMTSLEKRKED